MKRATFDATLEHQVEDLGNLNLGLRLIADKLRSEPKNRAARVELLRQAHRILVELPEHLRPTGVITELHNTFGFRIPPAPSRPTRPANAIVVPLVERGLHPSGLVRDLWIQRVTPYSDSTIFPSETDRDFRDALIAGARAARKELEKAGVLPIHKVPDDYEFHLQPGPFHRNPELRDGSVWLAAALSYFSLCGGLPLPTMIAATGGVAANGRLAPVSGLPTKVEACLRERPDIELIVAMCGSHQAAKPHREGKLVRMGTLQSAIEIIWGPRWRAALRPPSLSFYAAMERAKYAYAHEHDPRCTLDRLEILQRLLAARTVKSKRHELACAWRAASCHADLGDLDSAAAIFRRWITSVDTLTRCGIIDGEDYADFCATYGSYLLRRGRAAHAVAYLHKAARNAKTYKAPRAARGRLELALGNALADQNDHTSATRHLIRAYDLCENEDKGAAAVFIGHRRFHSSRERGTAVRSAGGSVSSKGIQCGS